MHESLPQFASGLDQEIAMMMESTRGEQTTLDPPAPVLPAATVSLDSAHVTDFSPVEVSTHFDSSHWIGCPSTYFNCLQLFRQDSP